MLTELFPYRLSISICQVSSDNGLPHVSLKVSIKDTKHEGLFGLKKALVPQVHYLEYSWGPGPHCTHGSWVLATMSRLLLKPSKYLSSLREGYAAISLLIPFLKPISSIAAGEYPVGLDEGMGPEGTGSGPLGLGRC